MRDHAGGSAWSSVGAVSRTRFSPDQTASAAGQAQIATFGGRGQAGAAASAARTVASIVAASTGLASAAPVRPLQPGKHGLSPHIAGRRARPRDRALARGGQRRHRPLRAHRADGLVLRRAPAGRRLATSTLASQQDGSPRDATPTATPAATPTSQRHAPPDYREGRPRPAVVVSAGEQSGARGCPHASAPVRSDR